MKKIFKKIIVLSMAFSLLISYILLFENSAFATTKKANVVKDFKVNLSNDGKVTATYTKAKNQLFISGNGKIDQKLWVKMVRKFNKNNYGKYIKDKKGEPIFQNGWCGKEDFDIVFDKKTKVKLCNSIKFDKKRKDGLFEEFDNRIYFNNAVDTSEVTDMASMFSDTKRFNQPLNFDTKNVRNMESMFCGTKKFNQFLKFDTQNVSTMEGMFMFAERFNQPLDFDTKNVKNMESMFFSAKSFNSPINFDTINVTDMSNMFCFAERFNQPLNFNTKNVKNMESMFCFAKDFNQPLNFNTKNVRNMESMFYFAENFNQPIKFNFKNVENMESMFEDAYSFNQLLNFNTLKAYNIDNMFGGHSFFNSSIKLDISGLDTPMKNRNIKNKKNKDNKKQSYILFVKKGCKNIDVPIIKLTLMNNDRLNEKVYQSLLKYTVANKYEFIKLGNFTFKLPTDYTVKNLTTKKQEEVKKGVIYKFKKGNNYLLINKNPKKLKKGFKGDKLMKFELEKSIYKYSKDDNKKPKMYETTYGVFYGAIYNAYTLFKSM